MANQEQLELLNQGVEVWNRWRTENPQAKIDLSGASIRVINLRKVNLSEADLRNASFDVQDLIEANFSGANLSGATFDVHGYSLPANLSRANLSGANLTEAKLKETNLTDANFCEANLARVNFHSVTCHRANFTKAIFREAILWNSSPDKNKELTWEEDEIVEPSSLDYIFDQLRMSEFHEANFTQADFSYADLRYANFDGSNLSYTNFLRADLHEADFSRANLDGANIRETKPNWKTLVKASLIGVDISGLDLSYQDLSHINLKEANLSGVNLTAALAIGTNFEGAILTGACLQDWNINSTTKLHGVICEYVYLKRKQQERCPSQGSFKPGEFTTLSQKALETVNLIFANGIDWQAFFQSFQGLRLQYDDLSIQAIEKKSGGAFVIRLEVPPEADKAAIESQAKQLYEMELQLLQTRYQQQLQLKDAEIDGYRRENTNLLGIVNLLGSRPINAIAIAESQSMGNRNIYMGNGNYNERIDGNYIQGNYINMSQDLTQAAQQIQDLLQQLQNQGVTVEDAQQQVSTEMAKQAETDPTLMGKMVLWSKAMANKASETTVSEAAKMVLTLALKAAGIPLP